jgi:hypothetical protein
MSQKTVVVVINTIREIGEEEREKREEQLVAGAREGDGRESTYVHCIHRWSNKQAEKTRSKKKKENEDEEGEEETKKQSRRRRRLLAQRRKREREQFFACDVAHDVIINCMFGMARCHPRGECVDVSERQRRTSSLRHERLPCEHHP